MFRLSTHIIHNITITEHPTQWTNEVEKQQIKNYKNKNDK